MRKFLLRTLPCILLTLSLSACRDYIEEYPLPTKSKFTLMFYVVAENKLESYASSDINEILQAKDKIPNDCNVVMYIDDSREPRLYEFSKDGQKTVKTYPEQDSCDSLNFRKVLTDMAQLYPADSYALTMWSHGSGWVKERYTKTIGVDNNLNVNYSDIGSQIEIPSMRRMIEQTGLHFDYIFFDACFMQCVEVCYELRGVTDYVISSPAEIPGEGAPYHTLLSTMLRGRDGAEDIANNYYSHYANRYYGVVISSVKTSEMETLAKATKPFITKRFADKGQVDNSSAFQAYCEFSRETAYKPEYFDMGSVMFHLFGEKEGYTSWLECLHRAVPTIQFTPGWSTMFSIENRIYDAEHIAALSIFLPSTRYEKTEHNEWLRQYEWYKDAGWNETGW